MSRWTGSWLSVPDATDDDTPPPRWRGEHLGLPASGPGSVAGFGRRLAAIVVDWLPCSVAAQLLTENPGLSALVFYAILTVVSVTLFARTPGHALLGLRVATLQGTRPGPAATIVRTLLICLAIPPLMTDHNGRGLHDRLTQTLILHTR